MKKNDMFVDVVGEEKEVTKAEESTSFDYAVNRLKSDIEAAEKERKDSVISSKRGRLIRLIKEEIEVDRITTPLQFIPDFISTNLRKIKKNGK